MPLLCGGGHSLDRVPCFMAEICSNCQKKGVSSFYICKTCLETYCYKCKRISIIDKKCPIGHKLNISKVNEHSCDICLKDLNDEEVWRDAQCDLDICFSCIRMAQKKLKTYFYFYFKIKLMEIYFLSLVYYSDIIFLLNYIFFIIADFRCLKWLTLLNIQLFDSVGKGPYRIKI